MTNIKKNFLFNLIYNCLLIVIPIITTPYVSRVIGVEGVGIYSYSFSIANMFVLFAMLGLKNYGNRSIAKVRDNRVKLSITFWEIYTMQAIVAGGSILIYIYYIVSTYSNENIAYFQILYVVSSIFDISWFYFGIENFKITVIRSILVKVITTISIFTFVKSKNDLWLYTMILGSGTLVSNLLLWPLLGNYIDKVKINIRNIKKHFKPNLVLFVPVIAVSIYKIMDKIMLGKIALSQEVGYYENAEKIIILSMGVVTSLGIVMLPRITNLVYNGSIKESKKYIEKSMFYVMTIASALSFGIAAIAPIFVPVFFGKEFMKSSVILILLSVTILFLSWSDVIRSQFLIPNGRDKVYIVSVFVGAIINLFMNVILIPRFYSVGAAIGTIFAEAGVCFYQSFCVRGELDLLRYLRGCIPGLVSGTVMFISVRSIGVNMEHTINNLIIQIAIGGFIYCLISLIYYKMFRKSIYVKIRNKIKL